MCPEVAACLGLETRSNPSMWKDRAIVEMTVAVMHSFRNAGMGESVLTVIGQSL
jgi:nitric-oxide synthase